MVGNLKWWLVFLSTVVGLGAAITQKHIGTIWRVDFHKISFVTLTTYFMASAFMVFLNWRNSQGDRIRRLRYQEEYEYSVTLMTMLGLIGTVVGFMELLATSFASLASPDVAIVPNGIGAFTAGSSTALINTLVSLLGAVGLKLQVFNLKHAVTHE